MRLNRFRTAEHTAPNTNITQASSLSPRTWRRNSLYALVAIGLLIFHCGDGKTQTIPESEEASINRYWNDAARYLAGMEPLPDSKLSALESKPEAQKHRAFFQEAWPRVDQKMTVMRNWARSEILDARASERTIFYPFSGPDFLNLFTFFPEGPEYIMFGLEPPGEPPRIEDIPEADRASYLANIQLSMKSITAFSFYRTLSMREDFNNDKLYGLAPAIMVYIARTGNRLVNVESVYVGKDGELHVGMAPSAQGKQLPADFKARLDVIEEIPGIRFQFMKANDRTVYSLVYFSVNVADDRFVKRPWFAQYLESKGPTVTYIKAASYLMHYPYFSKIREEVQKVSAYIMQEDSGMPLKSFDTNEWNLRFYGAYTRPIPLFRSFYQEDLRAVYTRGGENVRPLPFGLGYMYREGTSNLMVAVKKTESAEN
ncbi:MAG: hypothetical protein KDK30_09485 [Leptospiraceae bacterium]|nr:hypothetical protein [Leptospiraceae bacterium]